MSEDVFPRRNLPASAEPWGRKHDEVSRSHTRRLDNLELATVSDNRANAGQLGVIGRQVTLLADQQEALSAQQQRLDAQQQRLDAQQQSLSDQQGQLSAQQSELSAQQGQLSAQQATLTSQQSQISAQVTELNQRFTSSTSPANLQLIRGGSAGTSGPAARTVNLPAPQGGRRTAVVYGSGRIAWTGSSTGSGISDGVTVGIEFRQSGTRRWYKSENVNSAMFFSFEGSQTFSIVVPVNVPAGGSTWDIRMWVGRSSSGGQANAGARLEAMNFTISYGNKY